MPTSLTRSLDEMGTYFPLLAPSLKAINEALRHINFGQMDHLPYYEPIEGYSIAIRAPLEPQGPGRPPSVGHWQLEVTRADRDYRLLLQGRTDGDRELGELWFPGDSADGDPAGLDS